MIADKTNEAQTRQCNKKQERNLLCDQQGDDEVPKTYEVLNTGYTAGYTEGCEILTMLRLPKLLKKGFARQPFFCGHAKKI